MAARSHALVAGPGGAAETIVFLHGLGGSQSTWQVVLGELVERYRVAAIDLPGHGASDKTRRRRRRLLGRRSRRRRRGGDRAR